MLRRAIAATAAVLAVSLAAPQGALAAPPPPGAISKNVKFVTNIPEMTQAISIAFIKDTMFVSTTHGLYSYDVSDPTAPQLLGALPMYIWENEDMTVDVESNLVFISRDPRGFTTPVTPGSAFPYGAVHIVSVKDPAAMVQLNIIPVPAGHTTTCINKCDFIWTSGPVANPVTQPDWSGRPIFATDVRNPHEPVACPQPIDTKRNDGVTDYVHDVQVDPNGIAWVSGAGGVRGYWTSGRHKNPVTGKMQDATGCKPIPYAGGGTPEGATPSRFMHNSWHNPRIRIGDRRGDVLFATEEELSSSCATSGRFATYDLKGSYNGEGFKNIDKTHFRMKVLDTWTPEKAPGATGCASAHYLSDRGDGLLAYAFYNQGTRFLDASNPKNIRQIGYFRPDDADTWAPYWRKGYVFIADSARGVDIVKLKSGSGSRTVAAPIDLSAYGTSVEMDEDLGYLCPLPIPER